MSAVNLLIQYGQPINNAYIFFFELQKALKTARICDSKDTALYDINIPKNSTGDNKHVIIFFLII